MYSTCTYVLLTMKVTEYSKLIMRHPDGTSRTPTNSSIIPFFFKTCRLFQAYTIHSVTVGREAGIGGIGMSPHASSNLLTTL